MERRVRELQVVDHVEWFDEMSNSLLRKLYQLPQVVVCDQFDPSTGYLGAIGREASVFGCPLITSFERYNERFFGRDIPPHVFPATTTLDIERAMHALVSAGVHGRCVMRAEARAWSVRNLLPGALIPKFIEIVTRHRRTDG
jgi:hypothetical protein